MNTKEANEKKLKEFEDRGFLFLLDSSLDFVLPERIKLPSGKPYTLCEIERKRKRAIKKLMGNHNEMSLAEVQELKKIVLELNDTPEYYELVFKVWGADTRYNEYGYLTKIDGKLEDEAMVERHYLHSSKSLEKKRRHMERKST